MHSFFSESLSMKSRYLSIQNYGSFWRQSPSHMYLVFVIDKNVLHPSDKSALCAAFFRKFIGELGYLSIQNYGSIRQMVPFDL